MQRETRASHALSAWVDELDDSGNQLRTQQDLAKILSARLPRDKEIAQSTVSAWCAGKSQPRGDAMVALQEIAGVQLAWWLEVIAEAKTGTEG